MTLCKVFTILVTATGLVSALGINCRGSSSCAAQCGGDAMVAIQGLLNQEVQNGRGGAFYAESKDIACTVGCCAFYQNGASGTIDDALAHINNLRNHGCNNCGSDPTQPGNDVATGELTVNYVSDMHGCSPGWVCAP